MTLMVTAAAPLPSDGRRPLGEVLVDRGILTPEQLTLALERQRTTGQQLGEIIVALGFAPGPIVAQALATQRGGMLKTEYGFATGWSSDDAPVPIAPPGPDGAAELAERDRTIAELRAWAEKAQVAIASRDEALAILRAQLEAETARQGTGVAEEEADLVREAQAEAERELAQLRAELEAEIARRVAAAAQHEEGQAKAARELAALRAEREAESTRAVQHEGELSGAREGQANAERELGLLRAELAAESSVQDTGAAQQEAELARAREGQAKAERELATARRTSEEVERRLENARSRADTLARRVAEHERELEALRAEPAAEPSRWASAPSHYVLRRGAGGYELVAHDGPPPAVGDTVDGLRVARIGPAAPGLDVPCAYLGD
jgi:hypothetical protein